MSTRPLPHHFSGRWDPPQIDDLEACLAVLVEDLALVDATATAALASAAAAGHGSGAGTPGPMGPPGRDGEDADSGFWPIVDQRPRVTQAQVLARVYLGT